MASYLGKVVLPFLNLQYIQISIFPNIITMSGDGIQHAFQHNSPKMEVLVFII
ncbi:hypothetical protein Mpsy_1689 [Methanolobus psychrophilus R15]|nr:hypothetical protein Mpsy_1689 [Methanolobus psychrophilus R15]